jgi:hypothetical protein
MFADQNVNGFGPADIEKSHIKGIFGCIFKQRLMKYGGNKSIKENILRRSATLNFREYKDRNSRNTHFRVNKGNILNKKYINL